MTRTFSVRTDRVGAMFPSWAEEVHVIRADPLPRSDEEGKRSFSIGFPALVVTPLVDDPERFATQVAKALSPDPVRDAAEDLLAACVAFVAGEDKLMAELRAEGKDPAAYGWPHPLVEAMRAAIAKAKP